jgi:hypothetical protein
MANMVNMMTGITANMIKQKQLKPQANQQYHAILGTQAQGQ